MTRFTCLALAAILLGACGPSESGDADATTSPDAPTGPDAAPGLDAPGPDAPPGCVDGDGDGYGVGLACTGPDCDDLVAAVNPAATEVCDGVDNDCNGMTDDGFGTLSCGLGGCANTVPACAGGMPQVCTPLMASPETCDGIDDDCDGMTDDGNPGGGGACATGLPGVCAAGAIVCTGGALTCTQTTAPAAESCNGLDDDCDGMSDEGNPGAGASCATGLPGACGAGATQCVGGALQCNQTVFPTAESCDGVDQNCDAVIDDVAGLCPASDHLVISEVRSRGAAGAADEFVELYNPTTAAITLDSSWSIHARSSTAMTFAVRFTGAMQVIPSYGHLIIGGTMFTAISADGTLSSGITDASSIKLVHSGATVDVLCYCFDVTTCTAVSAVGFECEGTPASNLPHNNTTAGMSNSDASLERKPGAASGSWQDTNDNTSDFQTLAPAGPQNAATPPFTP